MRIETDNQSEMFKPATGEQLRDAGMKQATDHADEVVSDWSKTAKDLLLRYIHLHGADHEFKLETVRAKAEAFGEIEAPPDSRSWGSIVAAAARADLIECVGYAPSSNAKAHKRPTTVWRIL